MDFYWIDKEEEKRANRRSTLFLVALFSAVGGAVFNEIFREKMETQEIQDEAAPNILKESADKTVFLSSGWNSLSYQGEEPVQSVNQAMSSVEEKTREQFTTYWAIALDSQNKEIARIRCKPRFRQPSLCKVYKPL